MRFQLLSSLPNCDNDPISDERRHPETTREQQEVRVLLRFGAFLVKRHTLLDLLIWPSDSPKVTEYVDNSESHTYYIDVVANTLRIDRKPVDKEPTDLVAKPVTIKDRNLNATKIRRYTWSELLRINLDDVTIDDKAESSEVYEGHDHFWSVDKHGYITRSVRAEKGFQHVPVVALITAGRKRGRLQAERGKVAQKEAEQKQADQKSQSLSQDNKVQEGSQRQTNSWGDANA